MRTNISIEAAEPDVYMGLGSAAYALAKSDGEIQAGEVTAIRKLFKNERHGDLAFHCFLIKEYHDESEEEAYAFAMRRLSASRHLLDDNLKKHLISLLWKIVQSSPKSTCQQEHDLVRRFQYDLRKL